MTSVASTSTLSAIGSSSEPNADVWFRAPREPAVDLVGRHRHREDGRRPVQVTGEVPREQHDHDRPGERPHESQLVGQVTVRGEYAAHASLLEGARREPRRDRDPHLPHAARARDRRVAVFSDADRARARRGERTRRTGSGPGPAAESYLRGDASSRSRAGGRGGDPSRATGSLPRTPRSRELVEEAGLVVDRATVGRDRADGLEDRRARRRCAPRASRSSRGRSTRRRRRRRSPRSARSSATR